MRGLILNCTLKASPERSNTEALLDVVADALRDGIDTDVIRCGRPRRQSRRLERRG